MSRNLSRRELLKMAAGLAATGAGAWVPDRLRDGDVMAALEAEPEEERAIALEDEQPFAPYFLDPDSRMWKVAMPRVMLTRHLYG